MSEPRPEPKDTPAHYSKVVYMPAVTGGPVIVDDSPGASDRFWQAMIDSVRSQQIRMMEWREIGHLDP